MLLFDDAGTLRRRVRGPSERRCSSNTASSARGAIGALGRADAAGAAGELMVAERRHALEEWVRRTAHRTAPLNWLGSTAIRA